MGIPEKPSEGSSTQPVARQEGSLQERMGATVARGQAALKKAEAHRRESLDISKNWKAARKETPGGAFSGNEVVRLTGHNVNVRDIETGRIIGSLKSKDITKINSDPKRIEVNGVAFVAVYFEKAASRAAYIAERYLEKTVPQKVFEAAWGKERIEIPEGEMLEEVVMARAARQFSDKPARDTWKRFLIEYKQNILDKGLQGSAVRDAEIAVYRKIFGSGADLYEDKIQRAFELLASGKGKIREEAEVVKAEIPIEQLDQAFTEMLGDLGYDIGTFYGMGPMTGEEVRNAFDIQHVPPRFGTPGSKITFRYEDGSLHIDIPGQEAVAEKKGKLPGEMLPAVKAQAALHIQPTLSDWYPQIAAVRNKQKERRAQIAQLRTKYAPAA